MQILGVAGKRKSGKTTLLSCIAKRVATSKYGHPVRMSYNKEDLPTIRKMLLCERSLEWHRLDEGGTETFVLIDDVNFPDQVDQIHSWGGNVLFVCADGRFPGREDDPHPSQKMSNDYTAGKSSELFDFCITNHNMKKQFTKEAGRFMHLFLGGDASYEAGLF